ncbi:hypothetical protein AB0J82_02760, partial [Asanoa sp. NPDC049518]|uniref:hypothetical protein n=1 Tax=Asanoa sp. NPDC049518 TaxID=3155503 RepID=UPI0034209D09
RQRQAALAALRQRQAALAALRQRQAALAALRQRQAALAALRQPRLGPRHVAATPRSRGPVAATAALAWAACGNRPAAALRVRGP